MKKSEIKARVKHAYEMQSKTVGTSVMFKVYADAIYILDNEEDNVIEICETEEDAIECCKSINEYKEKGEPKSNCYYKPYLADEKTGNPITRADFKFYDKKTFETAKEELPELSESIKTRFKILALLALNIGVWEDKMQVLGDRLDERHPQAMEALKFYEDKIIEVLGNKEKKAA